MVRPRRREVACLLARFQFVPHEIPPFIFIFLKLSHGLIVIGRGTRDRFPLRNVTRPPFRADSISRNDLSDPAFELYPLQMLPFAIIRKGRETHFWRFTVVKRFSRPPPLKSFRRSRGFNTSFLNSLETLGYL